MDARLLWIIYNHSSSPLHVKWRDRVWRERHQEERKKDKKEDIRQRVKIGRRWNDRVAKEANKCRRVETKGPVEIYQVPRLWFWKKLSEKKSSPPKFFRKKSFLVEKILLPLFFLFFSKQKLFSTPFSLEKISFYFTALCIYCIYANEHTRDTLPNMNYFLTFINGFFWNFDFQNFVVKKPSLPYFFSKKVSAPFFLEKLSLHPNFCRKDVPPPPFFLGKLSLPPNFFRKNVSAPFFLGKKSSPPVKCPGPGTP